MRAVGFSSAEFGNLNLWFPNSSIEPAAATGCRLSLPAASGRRPCRPGSACPTNFGGGLGEREAAAESPPAEAGSARPSVRKEACGFADLGRSNLWRPMVVDRMRGSRWVQAQPAGSKWVQAQPAGSADMSFPENFGKPQTSAASIYGGRQSSPEPAAATGCRHCRPGGR